MFGPKAMKGFFGGWHRPGFGHGPRRGRMFEKGGMEYVSATQRDGKKVYAITEEGRKFLDENRRSVQDIWGKFGGSWDPGVASELHEIRHDLMDLGKLFGQQMREGRVDQEKLARIRSVISAATREIEDILREREDPGTTSV